MNKNFQRVMDDDPNVASRFGALAETIIRRFAGIGVEVSAEELLGSPTLRIASIAPDAGFDIEVCIEEVRNDPALSARMEIGAVSQALESGEHQQVDLSHLTPCQKMELGRKIEAQKAANARTKKVDPETEAQRIEMLRQISDPQVRLSLARQWGLA
ncbi:hypothetical protein GCM10011324_05710 [Allosediminivita pacifica]|nr:hypothetical protein GCM10011324_05710 [Allosediminivita pacifica]